MLRIYFISLHLTLLLFAGSLLAKDLAADIDSYSLNTSTSSRFNLFRYHFKPKAPCDLELEYTHFQLCYSTKHRIAKWAMHELTLQQIRGRQPRTNDFRPDFNVPNPVFEDSFRRSGFDRGHLVPAADFRLDFISMSETFYMTNMTPQDPGFNSGIWNSLEAHIRKEVERLGPAIVITAPVILDQMDYPMMRSKVTIPDEFYKIAYFYQDQSTQAYLIPNQHGQGRSFRSFKTTVRSIEQLTGIDFFSELPDALEEALETQI